MSIRLHPLIAFAAITAACGGAPDGYAIGACKTSAVWFDRALDAKCGKGVEDDTTSASAGFKFMRRCIGVPGYVYGGFAYTIDFDFASDANTCFHGPILSISGTNMETGKKETAFDHEFSCVAHEYSDRIRFVNEGGDLESPKATLTSGDWCASIRFTRISEEGPEE